MRKIQPETTLGFVGGADPFIVAVETAWPDPLSAPIYQARLSRHKGFTEIQKLAEDPRIKHDPLPALICFTDELEATAIADMGWAVAWCRVISGPGTEKEAQVLVNVQELETVLRRLAEQKRLRFPKALGALGRRAGGELKTEDHELVALGLACWYAYQVHDRTRGKAEDAVSIRHAAMQPKGEIETWESEILDLE